MIYTSLCTQNVLKSLDIEALHGILVYFYQLQSDKEMVSLPAAVPLMYCSYSVVLLAKLEFPQLPMALHSQAPFAHVI